MLETVRVLIFVHQTIAELRGEPSPRFLRDLQKLDPAKQEIVIIKVIGFPFFFLRTVILFFQNL